MVNMKLFGNLGQKEDTKEKEVVDSVESGGARFGVRSYIHEFYQKQSPSQTLSNEDYLSLFPQDKNESRCRRWAMRACRMISVVGILLVIAGAAAIIIGYSRSGLSMNDRLNIEDIHVEQDSQGGVWMSSESLHKLMQDPYRTHKMIGLMVFTVGGILLAVSLLIPTCVHCCTKTVGCMSAVQTPNDRTQTDTTTITTQSPVPANEKISEMQPKKDEEKMRKLSEDELLLNENEPMVAP